MGLDEIEQEDQKMTWKSLPMTGDCAYHYEKVRKFTLVKETPKAIRIRLENHPEKISIWMPKKITRGYTDTSAWFWSEALHGNVWKEEQKLKDKRQAMESSYDGDIGPPEPDPTAWRQGIKGKDLMEDKIHDYNPNKQVYNNSRRKK